jgi:hypothetical protein
LYSDCRKKARHEKDLKFRAARAAENLSRGKAINISTHYGKSKRANNKRASTKKNHKLRKEP